MSFASPGFNAHRGFNLLFGDKGTPPDLSAFYWNILDTNQPAPQKWTLSLLNRRAAIDQNPGGIMKMRANAPKSAGKLYFEEVFVTGADASFDAFQMIFGASQSTDPLPPPGTASPPNDFVGIVNGNVGRYYFGVGAGQANATGFPPMANGDVFGFAYDLNAQVGWISKNGVYAGGGNPATGTLPFVTLFSVGAAYPMTPCIMHQDAGGTAGLIVDLRMQASEFTQGPPAGFSAWLP